MQITLTAALKLYGLCMAVDVGHLGLVGRAWCSVTSGHIEEVGQARSLLA
jgi:hypothetical protein